MAPNGTTTGAQHAEYSLRERTGPRTLDQWTPAKQILTECIRTTVFHAGPYRTLADVECATVAWVDWYSNRRLHGTRGMLTPIEFETLHYEALTREPEPAK